jgi:hypothetical protein
MLEIEVAFNFMRKALYITQSTGKKLSMVLLEAHYGAEQNFSFINVAAFLEIMRPSVVPWVRAYFENATLWALLLSTKFESILIFLANFLLRFISNSSSPSSKFALPLAQVWFLLVQVGVWRVFECLNNRWLWVF